MNDFSKILNDYKNGVVDLQTANAQIGEFFRADLPSACIDFDRKARTGVGEVVFAASKTREQCAEICGAILEREKRVLITRLDSDKARYLMSRFENCTYEASARIMKIGADTPLSGESHIAIVTAGTSDIPAAKEAEFAANFFGSRTRTYFDCGVAGLHRLLSRIDEIRAASVVVAIAGMEGALASVLAGLVKVPVIAVPTSVGYGANFGGLSALLSMINSCANGVSVVNIDNGFGAAYTAHLINSAGGGK